MVFFLWLKVSNRMQQTGFAMESCQFPSMDLTPTTPCPDDLDAPVAPPYHLRSSPDLPEIFSGLVLGWGWYLEGFWCCGWDLQKLEGSCPPQGSGLLSAAQKFLVFWPEMAMRIEKFANNKSLIAFFFTKVSFFFLHWMLPFWKVRPICLLEHTRDKGNYSSLVVWHGCKWYCGGTEESSSCEDVFEPHWNAQFFDGVFIIFSPPRKFLHYLHVVHHRARIFCVTNGFE